MADTMYRGRRRCALGDPYNRGPMMRSADDCAICGDPVLDRDGAFCSDACEELDYCRFEIRSLEQEVERIVQRALLDVGIEDERHPLAAAFADVALLARRIGRHERRAYDLHAHGGVEGAHARDVEIQIRAGKAVA
jgi:predicted nucleic acid-binding Zn ribbon protein